ncbi:hypothetical protein BC834DRAFT_606756 [Gloeopeniophorella convolvens]|nr:hypothetical protein BC834DRAFT_606756 [Gloeopeniophorella convolvens]
MMQSGSSSQRSPTSAQWGMFSHLPSPPASPEWSHDPYNDSSPCPPTPHSVAMDDSWPRPPTPPDLSRDAVASFAWEGIARAPTPYCCCDHHTSHAE